MAGREVVVETPLPSVPLVSLLSVIKAASGSPRWQTPDGVLLTAANLDGGGRLAIDCLGNSAVLAPDQIDGTGINRVPFLIKFAEKCSTFGLVGEERLARVRAGLEAITSYEVANELWLGTITGGAQVALRDPLSDVVTVGAGDDPEVALGKLEGAFAVATKGQRALIHVTPQTLTALFSASAIRLSGTLWVTANGNVVIADAGYPGTGPTAQAGVWMYSTTMLTVRLTDPWFAGIGIGPVDEQGTNIDVNTAVIYGQRLALIEWDEQGLFAAKTNLTAPLAGGAS